MSPISQFLIPGLTALASLIGLATAVGKFSAKAKFKRRAAYWNGERAALSSPASRERAEQEYKEALARVMCLEQFSSYRVLSTACISVGIAGSICVGIWEGLPASSSGQLPDIWYLKWLLALVAFALLIMGSFFAATLSIATRVTVHNFVEDLEYPEDRPVFPPSPKKMAPFAGLAGGIIFALVSMASTVTSVIATKDPNGQLLNFFFYFAAGGLTVVSASLLGTTIRETSKGIIDTSKPYPVTTSKFIQKNARMIAPSKKFPGRNHRNANSPS